MVVANVFKLKILYCVKFYLYTKTLCYNILTRTIQISLLSQIPQLNYEVWNISRCNLF